MEQSYLVIQPKKLEVMRNLWYIDLAAAFVTRGSTGSDRCYIIRGTKAKGVNVPSNKDTSENPGSAPT